VTQTTFPSTLYETYGYDQIYNLTSKTDRKNQTIQYVYDALDRLTSKSYPDSTSASYVYDLVGKIKQVTDPTGTYGFAYDNMGRLTGTTTQYSFLPGYNFQNGYTYDAASNRKTLTAPDGSTNTYNYDTLNRLSSLTNSLTGQFGFSYDALSRRTQLTRPNGINTNYGYDSVSHLLSVLHQSGSTTLDGASYGYDAPGNRTSKTNYLNNVTEGYTYDLIYQLTQVAQGLSTTESYSYDAVGNRLSSLSVPTYNYNASNELTSNSSGSYTYDNNGNSLTDAQGRSYTWDFENRLTQVVNPGVGTTTFKYDPFGRRIQKSGPLGTTNYLYDGARLLEELDNSGGVVVRYTQASAIDEPLAQLRSGTTTYHQADGLSSITSITNTAGTIASTYVYDAFGKLSASSGTVTNPFQYTGREFDAETGIYYYRARYYDPSSGRFLGEDPLGFKARDANLFQFVRNAPTNFIDPLGLISVDPAFRPDCQHSLMRALNILHRLPKSCDCAFSQIGSHVPLSQLLQNPRIIIHYDPEPMTTSSGDVEGGYTLGGNTNDIWIRPYGCNMGAWQIAQTLVHELTHITLVPKPDVQEDEARGMERVCGLSPLSYSTTVTVGPGNVPTIPSTLPDRIE
jgi:RHS repeat-associated protein